MGLEGAILLAFVFLLFVLTAALSVAETSLVRTSKPKAMALLEEGRRGARALLELVERPESFLPTILLLVFACQTTGATLFGIAIEHALKGPAIALATALEVVVVFLLAEAIPKNWAISSSERAALLMAPLILALVNFPPLRYAARAIDYLARAVIRRKGAQAQVSEKEILALADVAAEERVIELQERALIHSIIHFGDTLAREVMTPRPEIVAAPEDFKVEEVLDLALRRGYSRLPVYRESLDEVSGIAILKDLIALTRKGRGQEKVSLHLRPASFFPETKKVSALLRQMQSEGIQMALLIDEYGSLTGLVTLEDLIEELVGEIVDEYDKKEPVFEVVSVGEVRVSGRMSIDAARELTGADLPEGAWDTVGGLLLTRLGHLPRPGEYVDLDGCRLIADRVTGRRISRVRIKLLT